MAFGKSSPIIGSQKELTSDSSFCDPLSGKLLKVMKINSSKHEALNGRLRCTK